ncbi:MAG TPA: NUDIX domain-containing protein [Blastocatellia bacterium]|jgi:ADP-ribose pyrophosphatase YjhB (NUDIX family)|nr:NUDIX domain-containing protein [Blastocatellia bacterium]
MLKKVLGALWRRTPGGLRRLSVRLSQPRFTVTAGAVITDGDDRILLLKHVFRVGSGWGIPGGFINKGEQPDAALRREVHEEIGLELDSVELAFVRTLKKSGQVEIYFRAAPRGTSQPRGIEIKSVGWFKLDELPEGLSRDQRKIIERVLNANA